MSAPCVLLLFPFLIWPNDWNNIPGWGNIYDRFRIPLSYLVQAIMRI